MPPRRADDQVLNLLGALTLAVHDRVENAIRDSSGEIDSSSAALSSLHHFLEDPSIELLSQVLGLSHSGTVRLVDRLERSGYVARKGASDNRATAVRLTAAGRRAARRVVEARFEALEKALGTLGTSDRETFGRLAGQILAGMVRPAGARRWMCRMCDTGACGRDEGLCPVATAAKAEERVI